MPVPFIPNITPFLMPEQGYERLLSKVGILLQWRQAHACPCMYAPPMPGSANPQCQTCQGRGVFWDAPIPSAGFMGLLTWRHMSPSPDEFGGQPHEVVGLMQHGEPTLTIPFTDGASGRIWHEASVFDAYVELDATTRFTADLSVSGITAVPYQTGLSIPATGAVRTYDQVNNVVVNVSGYTVSGANVFLPAAYPPETTYTVEFTACPVFVSLRKAGAFPMSRPFGAGIGGVNNLPRRFRIQTLDMWLRAREFPNDASAWGA